CQVRWKQSQAGPVGGGVVQLRCPRCGVELEPIAQGECHFPYGYGERDSDLRAPCRSSGNGGFPPSSFQVGPKQIQARRVAAAEPQIEFVCFGADCVPIVQDESHFPYARGERDSDLRAPCSSSGNGGLLPSSFQVRPKQIQARPIVVGVVQIRCPRCRVELEPIAQGESHFLYEL